jgi:NTP-dependent ternary system trypsin peptidase co-occuring protein
MADKGPAEWLDLADALTALRDQLAEAQARAYYSPIHLSVEEVTIEFGLELQRSAHANGGLRFGVVSVDGSGQRDRKATHTVTVRLTAHGEDGAPVDVSDVDDDA